MSELGNAYRQKLEARIDELSARLAVARAQAKGLAADGRIAAHDELAATQQKLKDLKARLATLRTASDSAWKDVKGGVETAWSDLSKAATRAMQRFKSPAPRTRSRK